MVQSKDASFKFISQKHLKELFDILDINFGVELDMDDVEVLSTEMVAIEPSLIRPDYIVKIGDIIFMVEFESSHVGTLKKKLFKLYVAAFDFKRNHENNKIVFFVVSTKEKSKLAKYCINDWDCFKFPIISLKDLKKEKIINNIETKIENKEKFSSRELLELGLTPILEKDKQSIISQFYQTRDILSRIDFPNNEIKTSVYGLVLMLSSMYFEELDPLRKDIQGDLMGKVDCVMEACQESFEEGVSKGFTDGLSQKAVEIACNLLRRGDSLEDVVECTGLSIEQVEELRDSL